MNTSNKTVAIPVDDNHVLDAHFGHSKQFIIYTVENNDIKGFTTKTPPPHEPGVLPKWLADEGVTDVIAGGLGQKAISLLKNNSINVFVGAPQIEAEQLAKGFINHVLVFKANYCDH